MSNGTVTHWKKSHSITLINSVVFIYKLSLLLSVMAARAHASCSLLQRERSHVQKSHVQKSHVQRSHVIGLLRPALSGEWGSIPLPTCLAPLPMYDPCIYSSMYESCCFIDHKIACTYYHGCAPWYFELLCNST